MSEIPDKPGSLPRLLPLVTALFAVIVCLHIGSALRDMALVRPSHLGVALNYGRGEINLLRPMMPGFNANGIPTAQEIPLWQAAAGLAFKLARSEWYGWANMVSLACFATSLWPLFQVARRYVSDRAAWWTLAFYLAQPLTVIMAGEAATDGFCLAVTIWFLFFADKMIHGSPLYFIPATVLGIVAALSKLPFFMAVGLCSVGLLFLNNPRNWRNWFLLATAGAISGAVLMIWTRYTNDLAAQALYPYYDLRLRDNPDLQQWFFGDLHTRLRPGLWIKGGWRFLHATLGVLPLVGLLLIALFTPGVRVGKLWIVATFAVTLVFTPVVLNHWHYFLMCCPPVAMLCGAVLARWEPYWANLMPRGWLRLSIAFVALAGGVLDGVVTMKIALDYDPFPKHISAILKAHTSPKDKIVIFGEPGWGGEVLFRSGRDGLSVYAMETPRSSNAVGLRDLMGKPEHLNHLKVLGYNKLVLLSESPVRYAVQAANPGARRSRILYPETIAPEADQWREVFRSEDILIKEIPSAVTVISPSN